MSAVLSVPVLLLQKNAVHWKTRPVHTTLSLVGVNRAICTQFVMGSRELVAKTFFK